MDRLNGSSMGTTCHRPMDIGRAIGAAAVRLEEWTMR